MVAQLALALALSPRQAALLCLLAGKPIAPLLIDVFLRNETLPPELLEPAHGMVTLRGGRCPTTVEAWQQQVERLVRDLEEQYNVFDLEGEEAARSSVVAPASVSAQRKAARKRTDDTSPPSPGTAWCPVCPRARFEGHSLMPVVKALQADCEAEDAVIVADPGLLRGQPQRPAETANLHCIVGAQLKSLPQVARTQVPDEDRYETLQESDGTRVLDIP